MFKINRYKKIIIFLLVLLIGLIIAENSFAEKIQFGGFSLKNNPLDLQLGEKMQIGGTIFYFTAQEEPKKLVVKISIENEIDLTVNLSLENELVLDKKSNKRMQEWSFSSVWDGNVPFSENSSLVYKCIIKAGLEGFNEVLIEKQIRVGISKNSEVSEDKPK